MAVLAGAKAVSHTATTVRLDPALVSAFGLPGCAEQSSIAETLNAATEQDVADMQAALDELFRAHGQSRQHDFTRPRDTQRDESKQTMRRLTTCP